MRSSQSPDLKHKSYACMHLVKKKLLELYSGESGQYLNQATKIASPTKERWLLWASQ